MDQNVKRFFFFLIIVMFAQHVSSQTFKLSCTISIEEAYTKYPSGKTVLHFQNDNAFSAHLIIDEGAYEANIGLLSGHKCTGEFDPSIRIKENEISIFCLGTANGNDNYPSMIKAINVSRLNGAYVGFLNQLNDDGSTWSYATQGTCKAAKQLF